MLLITYITTYHVYNWILVILNFSVCTWNPLSAVIQKKEYFSRVLSVGLFWLKLVVDEQKTAMK